MPAAQTKPVPLESWVELGSCRDSAIEFYTDDAAERRAAKAVCSDCPVQGACLDFALRNDEQFGVWGGMTPTERTRERQRRQAAVTAEERAATQVAPEERSEQLAAPRVMPTIPRSRGRNRRPWYHAEIAAMIARRNRNHEALSDAVALRHGVNL